MIKLVKNFLNKPQRVQERYHWRGSSCKGSGSLTVLMDWHDVRTRGELDQSSVGGHDLLCCIEARGSFSAESLLWGPLSIMPTMMSSLEVVHYFTSMAMYYRAPF